MNNLFLTLVLVCIVGCLGSRDWRIQRLNQFQQKYNNSQADIIFLLDVSGSVSDSGFNTEKEFVKSLLSQISVQPIASRVAVVSFGKRIKEDLDYIDYAYLDKDKCTFTKEFARIKHRREGATNMNGALLHARRLLDDATSKNLKRTNVNTVVFLLTDGYWNYGGSPYNTANLLRNRNKYDVEIFSVGVGRVSKQQLQLISGSSSNVIIARDFPEFASLATRIRGDQIEKLYKTVDGSLCGIQCDPRARCSCGTISGIYTCACPPGYYGSGLPGRCFECPRGTYKTYSSPDPCKPCPTKSVTKKTGSQSIRDCKCSPGYIGFPEIGKPCKPIECPLLPTTLVNGKVSSCGKYYGETCTFMCHENHHIANEVATSRKLTCTLRNGGTWDMPLPQCVPTLCQWPPNPPHMKLSCSGNNVGDKCAFTCNPGYILVGANERECRSDGQWSHSLPYCQIITCPAIRRINHVNISPVKCFSSATNFNDACVYSCKPGFKYVSGDQKRICQADGTWSGVELACKDLTPPTITCPETITADNDIRLPFKEINFSQPTIRDNSIAGRDDITLHQDLPHIKSPYKFPVGVTLVNFTATDAAGNSDSCTFRVEIVDREKPRFTYCPSDIPTTTTSSADISKLVQWDMPTYSDNSGQSKLIYSSHNNPSEFPVGPANKIEYVIEDPSKNRASCEFFIQVEPKSCPQRDPPINGAIGCNYVGGYGHMCTPSCQNPYDFKGPLAHSYVCTVAGIWLTLPPSYPSMWPDCTAMQPQEGMGQNMKFFYFSGNCHNSVQARKQIADNFIKILDRILRNDGGCSNAANSRVCKGENVQIKCGKIQSRNGRRRRSVQNKLTIQVDVEVLSKEKIQVQKTLVQTLASNVKKIKQQVGTDVNQLKAMHINGDTMVLDRIEEVGSITGVCLQGMVFDRVDKESEGQIKSEETCVSCIAGSYFDMTLKKCLKCPKGTYTEYPGLLGCKACPDGKTTLNNGTSNSTHCKAPCLPGMYSKTGLENCQACKRGMYQPKPFSTSCLQCPGSTITLGEAATSLKQCGMVCPSGTSSKTGVEPCEPCSVGFYQANTGKSECIQCPKGTSTYAVGSEGITECKVIDECISKPCMNGGVCRSGFNAFFCECKKGFFGARCEEEKNECAENPCYGQANCVDRVDGFVCVCPSNYKGKFCHEKKAICETTTCQNGGTCSEATDGVFCSCKPGWQGKFCEQIIDECSSSPCSNGATCIDSHRGFTCKCKPGFTDATCKTNIDDCEQNNLCLNGGSCVDGINEFSCKCRPGYVGNRCQLQMDECISNPCRNGGTCVDKVNGYQCNCAPSFHGVTCEKKRTVGNFDMVFDRTTQGYAESTLFEDLHAFTISFWIKTSSDDIESGTVLSYAVGDDVNTEDNALVLRDMNHMLLVVLGEEFETKISANDDHWHHIAVTWSGKTGKYQAFKDGLKVTEESGVKQGRFIPSAGVFILGQEQDEVGRNFSASEALHGSLSQFNMWNHVLPENEILGLSSYRCDLVMSNMIGWVDLYDKTSDQVLKQVDLCKVQNTKFTSWQTSQAAAPTNAIGAQCITSDHKSINQLNLIGVMCTSNGFSCKDTDQTQFDPHNTMKCPTNVLVRYEVPHAKGNYCKPSSCSGKGKCVETLAGYVCSCNDGFTGKNCQKERLCAAINNFPNGYVSTTGNKFTFNCDPGYTLNGPNLLYCSAGKLEKQLPQCVDLNECSVSNGNCQHLCVNTMGSYRCECNKGFRKSAGVCIDENECAQHNCQDRCVNTYGSYTCQCRVGFKLSSDGHSCKDINECQTNTHQCKQLCRNTRSSYKCQCKPGFYLGSDGTSCLRLSCPSVRAPSHGKVSQGYGDYETKISYSCNNGYRLDGPFERTCQADGRWSGAEPKCQRVICSSLPSPYNGKATRGSSGAYTFSCLNRYLLRGDTTRQCLNNGTWSGVQPRCIAYHCAPVNPPKNGVVIGLSLTRGATIIIECNEGYMLKDKINNYRSCQDDGVWSGHAAQCVAVNCGQPESINNGAVTGTSFIYKDTIKYSCNNGYGLSGPPIRVCQLNGLWSGVKPTCLWNSCGYPGSLKHGQLIGSDFAFGRTVTYKCGSGYRLIGERERKCLLSGLWTGSVPRCEEISCGNPGVPVNGEKTGDLYTVNATVRFDCQPGYTLRGSRSIVCDMNGRWSNVIPKCQPGVCGAVKLVGPHGRISSPSYPNSYKNNEYCRWKIVVATNKLARLTVSSLKTVETEDNLELYDGKSGAMLSVFSGVLSSPMTITSPSNILDVRFITNGEDVSDGFDSTYDSAICGGHITSFGSMIQTPNFPSHYPSGVTCVWQIVLPGEKISLNFRKFQTADQYDKLEAWNSLSDLKSATKIGTYFGNRGSLLKIKSYQVLYLRFRSDSAGKAAAGFSATVEKDNDITF